MDQRNGPAGSATIRPATISQADQMLMKMLAGGPGFEPRLTESESAVLPLNYPPKGAERIGSRALNSEAARRRQVPRANPGARRPGASASDANGAPCLPSAID